MSKEGTRSRGEKKIIGRGSVEKKTEEEKDVKRGRQGSSMVA